MVSAILEDLISVGPHREPRRLRSLPQLCLLGCCDPHADRSRPALPARLAVASPLPRGRLDVLSRVTVQAILCVAPLYWCVAFQHARESAAG